MTPGQSFIERAVLMPHQALTRLAEVADCGVDVKHGLDDHGGGVRCVAHR